MNNKKIRMLILCILFLVVIFGVYYLLFRKDNSSNLIIELIGEENVVLEYNEKYNDLGAKAYYNNKDISSDIKVNTNIDFSKAGKYTYTYTINYNNLEKSVSRNVEILDEVNPYKVGVTSKGYTIEKKDDIYYINGILIANKSYPLPSSYNPGDLLDIFKDNFKKMNDDAKKEGVNLIIGSGFRSYNRQNTLYNNYVARDGKDAADRYSARPGHSEHQTGLAADIYGEASKDKYLLQSWGETNDGKWLNNNCYKYGFILRYIKGKEDETGYMYESWHIRYVGVDLATKLYNKGDWITLEAYLGIDSKY